MCATMLRFQEIMLMKQRVEEMEREASKLRELQAAAAASNAEGGEGEGGEAMETDDDKAAADSRSVYVGNVSIGLLRYLLSLEINSRALGSERLIMLQPRRRYKHTLERVAQ